MFGILYIYNIYIWVYIYIACIYIYIIYIKFGYIYIQCFRKLTAITLIRICVDYTILLIMININFPLVLLI